jgi:hypothetical protein
MFKEVRWVRAQVLMLAVLATFVVAPWCSAQEPTVLWFDVHIEEVGNWEVAPAEGSPLLFEFSPDGSMLALVGHGRPDEVRVTDHDLETLATLRPGGGNATVRGVCWSQAGAWLAAWGRAEGEDQDLFEVWDVPGFAPSDDLFENGTPPLAHVDDAMFLAYDEILALAGRDTNGTSRLLIVETSTWNAHRDIQVEDNATIVELEHAQSELLCISELGDIVIVSGMDWTLRGRFEGLDSRPTAFSLPSLGRSPWLMGYEDGRTFIWGFKPYQPDHEGETGNGPVDGVCWPFHDGQTYYVVARPDAGGGSAIHAEMYFMDNGTSLPISNVVRTEARVTMMRPDPLTSGHFAVGLSDGSLLEYNVTLVPDVVPIIMIDEPMNYQPIDELTGIVTFRGSVDDDHDRVKFVSYSIDGGEWVDVTLTGSEFTFEMNTTSWDIGEHNVVMNATDGRHWTTENRFINKDPPGHEDRRGDWFVAVTVVLVLVAVALAMLRRYRQGAGG